MWAPLGQRRWDSAVKWNGVERNDLALALQTRGHWKISAANTDEDALTSMMMRKYWKKDFSAVTQLKCFYGLIWRVNKFQLKSEISWRYCCNMACKELGFLPRSRKAECKCQVLCSLKVENISLQVKKFFVCCIVWTVTSQWKGKILRIVVKCSAGA